MQHGDRPANLSSGTGINRRSFVAQCYEPKVRSIATGMFAIEMSEPHVGLVNNRGDLLEPLSQLLKLGDTMMRVRLPRSPLSTSSSTPGRTLYCTAFRVRR